MAGITVEPRSGLPTVTFKMRFRTPLTVVDADLNWLTLRKDNLIIGAFSPTVQPILNNSDALHAQSTVRPRP